MKRSGFIALLFAGFLTLSCNDSHFVKDDTGVTVKVSDPSESGARLVRLQVMGDKLIRVSATPERRFADPQSLVIIPSEEKVPFDVKVAGDTVSVVTSAICANVFTCTGEIWFADKDGKTVLREETGGGKSFVPIEVDGTKGWT